MKSFLQWGVSPRVGLLLAAWVAGFTASAAQSNRWSLPHWPVERTLIVSNMQHVMGPLPGASRRCALDLQVLDETDAGTFVRRRIMYTSEPGSRVNAFLLLPKQSGQHPAMLALHQTHPLGSKVVVGLGNSPNDEYAVELATRGYVVLAPPYPLLADYHPDLKKLGYVSGTMKAIWDNIRALDVLESLPPVKKGAFGAIGHSLGGHNALFTAAFDDRIKVIATSCAFDSFRDYMNGNIRGWTSDRYMPRLLDYPLDKLPFDFHDVLAALSPRHVFVSAPLGDTNFKWRSVDTVAQEAWKVYRLHKAEENLQIVHPDCGHVFPPEIREQAYRLFDKVLR
ncbi:MAG TPA: alpha/beta hydrolase [Verrucomicrobiae bacterium]|nr:alpha/beta hydrolase [Verrucomicrobiae bacterium]